MGIRTSSRDEQAQGEDETPRIVLYDHDPTVVDVLASLFEQQGDYEIKSVPRLEGVLEEISGARVDLAICELKDATGTEGDLASFVIESGTPVIVTAERGSRDHYDAIMGISPYDCVFKTGAHAYDHIVALADRALKNRDLLSLVVDDGRVLRGITRHMLERQCCEVVEAVNGAEALLLIEQEARIRLVVTDYNMPRMDGVEMTRAIRTRFPHRGIVVIGVSGSDDPHLSTAFLREGANDYLRRPFSYEELLCRVNQNLRLLDALEYVRHLAETDQLTGIPNRRCFFEKGVARLRGARSRDRSYAAILDIDRFKAINDTHGHACGDIVLRQVAKAIAIFFAEEVHGRIGGEEFAVLVTDVDHGEFVARCEGLRLALAGAEFTCGGGGDSGKGSLTVTVSVGVGADKGGDLDAMLRSADKHLYQAKADGRDRVVF
jgi:diguanylate cyclase (GGDEF)-like protein